MYEIHLVEYARNLRRPRSSLLSGADGTADIALSFESANTWEVGKHGNHAAV